ncbi:MAG TPA: hypothetical protein VFR02_04285, partial [bacterium]|nr:hypothetical protein [bacterium]
PAEDCTTGEVLRALGRAKASAEVREAAEKCLRACDRVLYAEGALSPKESLRGWAQALLPRAAKRP